MCSATRIRSAPRTPMIACEPEWLSRRPPWRAAVAAIAAVRAAIDCQGRLRPAVGHGLRELAQVEADQHQAIALRRLDRARRVLRARDEAGHRGFLARVGQEARQVAHVARHVALLAQVGQQAVEGLRELRQLVAAAQSQPRLVVAAGRVLRRAAMALSGRRVALASRNESGSAASSAASPARPTVLRISR